MCVFILSKLLLVKHRTPNLAHMASHSSLVAAPPVANPVQPPRDNDPTEQPAPSPAPVAAPQRGRRVRRAVPDDSDDDDDEEFLGGGFVASPPSFVAASSIDFIPICLIEDIQPLPEGRSLNPFSSGVDKVRYQGQDLELITHVLPPSISLTHANIVRVLYIVYKTLHDRELSHDPVGFCTECVARPISDRVFGSVADGVKMSFEQLLDVFYQIASALTFAHEHGVIHYNVKPDSIRLDDTCTVAKLWNFGSARKVHKELKKAQVTRYVRVGSETSLYLAPEVYEHGFEGSSPNIVLSSPESAKLCDIYAFGKTMWIILHPSKAFFPGGEYRVRANVPYKLKKLVEQCTQSLPSERPQSISEVFHRLHQILKNEPESIPDDCNKLGLILKEISALDILRAVVKSGINDSKLELLSKMPPQMLQQLFGLPSSKADVFIAKCHLMSNTVVDPDHESWCKACLIMRSCGQGVRPFVALVMQKLHERVVNEIKESILCYKDKCDDSEWTFPEDGKKGNPDFDARPVELQIVTFDPQGAAVSHVPHGLGAKEEPFLISKHSSAGVFRNADLALGSSFAMRSFPEDALSKPETERRFKMSQIQSWSQPFLNPFQVRRDSDGACFLVVYCRCRVGEATKFVNDFIKELKMPAVGNHADSPGCFWTIKKQTPESSGAVSSQSASYRADDHSLCSGDCVTFSAVGEALHASHNLGCPFSLPNGIALGCKYVVVNPSSSKKSFDISVTLVPANPFEQHKCAEDKAQQRLFISRPPFPSGLFREAVYRYHTKGKDCNMADRWKGVRVRDVPTDYGEFAKFFCSTTQQDLRIFDPDEDRSPELLYNMIQCCKVFQNDIFIELLYPRRYMIDEKKSFIRDHVQKIFSHAKGVGECRNTICHGNFHLLDQSSFENLKEHSKNLLLNISNLAEFLQGDDTRQGLFSRGGLECKWDCVIDAATAQYQDIFVDDPSANPPRVCISNRPVLSVFLSQNEQMRLNAMISQFEIERRQKTEEIQKLALQVQSLEDRAAMIKNKIRFHHLPVIMKSSFDSQISGLQPMAKGGQGTLYKIEHRGQKLVVKLYDGQSNGVWRRELNTLTALLHPNIVEVRRIIYENFSSSKERDLQEPIGYAMECMDRSAGDGVQCSVEQLLGIFEQIADALQFAHERGIIHFDVKPENILLNSECTVAKLCDFGWAHKVKSASASESANSATASSEQGIGRRGTVYYMAPECFSSAASAATVLSSAPLSAPTTAVAAGFLSPAPSTASAVLFSASALLPAPGNFEKSPLPKLCDIYSFGKTMWKLLHPLRDIAPNCAFPVTAQVPANLKKLVEQCTEKEPSFRPQEMSEVLQRLRLIRSDFSGAVAGNPQTTSTLD
jgi:serine/threonine protein kinase